MIRGLYTSGWSMQVQTKKMDVIANNLANVSTNGFKQDIMVTETFPDVLTRRIYDNDNTQPPTQAIGTMQLSNDLSEIYTNFESGNIEMTDRHTDMAISGSETGFFTVAIPNKNEEFQKLYTKDGTFQVNVNDQLVTKEGYYVLGETDGEIGVINLADSEFIVNEKGEIIQNDTIVSKLVISEFEDSREMRKKGFNTYEITEDAVEKEFSGIIRQGFVEQSNVNSVKEMVTMISLMRAYEANQKAIQAQDSTLDKAVNEVGRV